MFHHKSRLDYQSLDQIPAVDYWRRLQIHVDNLIEFVHKCVLVSGRTRLAIVHRQLVGVVGFIITVAGVSGFGAIGVRGATQVSQYSCQSHFPVVVGDAVRGSWVMVRSSQVKEATVVDHEGVVV